MPALPLADLAIDALVARLQNEGTRAQYDELIRRYEWQVLYTCRSYLSNREAARDAAAETWLRVLEYLPHTRIQHFPSWLHQVCYSVCQDVLRRQHRESQRAEVLSTELRQDPAAYIDHQTPERLLTENTWEPDEKLDAALAQLSQRQQRCIRLFYFERQSYREIAARTGYTEPQVRSALQNARLRLRRLLVGE
jgi:RNA polymerase sigma-70 factor (ECF subfamily)